MDWNRAEASFLMGIRQFIVGCGEKESLTIFLLHLASKMDQKQKYLSDYVYRAYPK